MADLVGNLHQLMQHAKVELCFGTAVALSPRQVAVRLPGGKERRVETEQIIIATGSRGVVLSCAGSICPA